MQYAAILQELGLTDHEARVYLASLEFASATAMELTKKTGLPRTSVQASIYSLYRKGLLVTYLKKRKKHWSAQNPSRLLHSLEEREKNLQRIMPVLQAMHSPMTSRPSVNTYIGKKDMQAVFDDQIELHAPLAAIMTWQVWERAFGKQAVNELNERRVRNRIPIRILTNRTTVTELIKKNNESEFRSIRFFSGLLPKDAAVILYADKIAFFSLGPFPMAVVIHDARLYAFLELIYATLWMQSEK